MVTFTHHTDYEHWGDYSKASDFAWKPNALFEGVADLCYTGPFARFVFKQEYNPDCSGGSFHIVPYALAPKAEEEIDRLLK